MNVFAQIKTVKLKNNLIVSVLMKIGFTSHSIDYLALIRIVPFAILHQSEI